MNQEASANNSETMAVNQMHTNWSPILSYNCAARKNNIEAALLLDRADKASPKQENL